ncbi:MAG TPA: hypothetical protein VEV16_08965 [Daejeonella sp.]|nr:hypothetical protein [Daejeonella sp.]
MKKAIYPAVLIGIVLTIFTACSSKRQLASNTFSRSKITGTWVLNSINYENIVENAVQTVFNQGPARDFQNSTWILTNSGNGKYSLTNGVTQNIFWSFSNVNGTSIFQFKKLDNEKAKNVTSGYQLEVTSANGQMLTLKAPVQYGGKTGYIVYNFSKK